jgi:hypothetical protein
MVIIAFIFGGVILFVFFSLIFISSDIDNTKEKHKNIKTRGTNKHSSTFKNTAAFAAFFSK